MPAGQTDGWPDVVKGRPRHSPPRGGGGSRIAARTGL